MRQYTAKYLLARGRRFVIRAPIWGCVAVLSAPLAGCGGDDASNEPGGVVQELKSDAPRASAGDAQPASQDEQDFSWSFFLQIAKNKNLTFSPYSISTAAAMLSAGAAGDTLEQMQDVLSYTSDGETFHEAQNALALALESRNHPASEDYNEQVLRSSNDLWMLPALRPPDDFLDTLATYYGAGVHLAAFDEAPDEAREAINDKVSDDTNGLVEELLPEDSVRTDTVFVLTNALYFKARWSTSFEEDGTESEPFTALDGSTGDVEMMHVTTEFDYAADDGYQALVLPYDGDELGMLVVVPDAEGFTAVRDELSTTFVNGILEETEQHKVELGMPKFSISTRVPLREELKAAGMTDAFDQALADFSGIHERVYVSSAAHEATVAVDEEGTEAAAATAFAGATGGVPLPEEPVVLTIDRPFLFVIYDMETGAMLFVGQHVSPET